MAGGPDPGGHSAPEPFNIRLDEFAGIRSVLLEELRQVRHGVVPRSVVTRQACLEERESEVLDQAVPKVNGIVERPPG